jgi:tetratricopeptide (TPR) repeat protein
VLVRVAETAAAAGRKERAVAALDELSGALRRSERPGEVAAVGGRLALELRASESAIALLGAAREHAPNDAGLAESHGLAFLSAGRLPEAAMAFEAACRLDPARASAHLNLAAVSAERGDRDAARRHAREALRLEPGYEKATRLLAVLEGR